MYLEDSEIKEIRGIYRYSYRNINYTSLENVIKSGVHLQVYVDVSILHFIERKGLEKHIEILKRGTHYSLVSINPEYTYTVDLSNLPVFAFRNKVDAFDLPNSSNPTIVMLCSLLV